MCLNPPTELKLIRQEECEIREILFIEEKPNVAKMMLEMEKSAETKLYIDPLTIITQLTKKYLEQSKNFFSRLQKRSVFRILTQTTQPAHFVAMLVVCSVLYILWPQISAEDSESSDVRPIKKTSFSVVLIYLSSFALHFGAQIWMTFVSGLALYFNLPRHTFGLCQEILFPKYFKLGAILSLCTLITFVKLHGNSTNNNWNLLSFVQVIALAVCAVIELTVCLYLAPPMLRLMHQKNKIEVKAHCGQEIGHFVGVKNRILSGCQEYKLLHKKFRQIHMVCAMGNMIAMVCCFVHLFYLASKIQIV